MDGSSETIRSALRLLSCSFLIYVAYLAQGIVQENLAVSRYGIKSEKLPHVVVMNLLQAIGAACTAALLRLGMGSKRNSKGKKTKGKVQAHASESRRAPLWAFVPPALSNSLGPACGVVALRYIPYPAQVLAKSCKMLPVMAMGVLLGRKKYTTSEYACGMLVSFGIAMFALFKAQGSTISKLDNDNPSLGYTLCLVNLVMDGYTNAAQDKIHDKYADTTALDMMYWMNIWGSCIMGAYFFGITRIGTETWEFVVENPSVLHDMLLFCACGIVGQLGIFYTIQEFGSLVSTIITTTRKFFSILISVVWNGNSLLFEQWVGVSMVFCGLMGNIWLKQRRKFQPKAKEA